MQNLSSLDRPLSSLYRDFNDVGVGYRRLKRGERVHVGDEFYVAHQNEWMPTQHGGGITVGQINSLLYRRKVESLSAEKFAELLSINAKLRTQIEELNQRLENQRGSILGYQSDSNVQRNKIADLQAKLATAQARCGEQSVRIGTMQNNASGNAVLVTDDGFSKPVTTSPFTYSYGLPASKDRPWGVEFRPTGKTDGFGRMIFREVS